MGPWRGSHSISLSLSINLSLSLSLSLSSARESTMTNGENIEYESDSYGLKIRNVWTYVWVKWVWEWLSMSGQVKLGRHALWRAPTHLEQLYTLYNRQVVYCQASQFETIVNNHWFHAILLLCQSTRDSYFSNRLWPNCTLHCRKLELLSIRDKR